MVDTSFVAGAVTLLPFVVFVLAAGSDATTYPADWDPQKVASIKIGALILLVISGVVSALSLVGSWRRRRRKSATPRR
jgi:hypothetical protein